ncbi:hypothetical protein O181_002255 [Austropuccinia psidii MF-1]|uniref:Uncharacterized protein n=1 Tax=Austropuccinia psidii MF-1 TaxID=1389203 RepID=A0A9Q3BCP1_9BASI|nr:hypothetical protein [Austropuccinia psidii MF-1]
MGNFRAIFRLFSPRIPSLNLPLPSSAHVEKLSNLSEGLPLTFPDTKVAESKVTSGTSLPTPSQPHKSTMSQLPAELATNQNEVPHHWLPVDVVQVTFNLTTSSINLMPQIGSTNHTPQKAPNTDKELEKSKGFSNDQIFFCT